MNRISARALAHPSRPLAVAAALVVAGSVWGLAPTISAVDHPKAKTKTATRAALSPSQRRYLHGLAATAAARQAAPVPGRALADLDMTPVDERYVRGILGLTWPQLQAAFGELRPRR
jgi:hypothetical protein